VRSAAVFPPEFGPLVVSSFHTVSSLATYLESFTIVHWCCRKPYVTLYRPESSGVSPSTSAEPPWSTASPFRWLRRGEKRVNRFARVWDHVGALGLAGDLAVAEKSPVNAVSVVRKKSLTCGSRCQ